MCKRKPYYLELSAELLERVSHYIEENYTGDVLEQRLESAICYDMAQEIPAPEPRAARKPSLQEVLDQVGESFQQRLLRFIDERGLTDPEVYKAANLDRKLFSKIRCSKDYIPKKKTIIALALALKLNLDDAQDLMLSAGYQLTSSSRADLIVMFCLENKVYNIYDVNDLLDRWGEQTLN